jgi:hypothetical protein
MQRFEALYQRVPPRPTAWERRFRPEVSYSDWFIEPMTRDWLDGARPWVQEPKSVPSFLFHERSVLSDREVTLFTNHLARYVRAREDAERPR